MKEEEIKCVIENGKWPFAKSDIWNRYFQLLFPLFLFIISISIAAGTGFKGDNTISGTFFFCFSLILFLIGIYLTHYTLKRIKKERIFYTIAIESNKKNQIIDCIKELNWDVIEENDRSIVASTRISWKSTTSGEVITIILNGDTILFNARANEDQGLTNNRDYVHFWNFHNLLRKKRTLKR